MTIWGASAIHILRVLVHSLDRHVGADAESSSAPVDACAQEHGPSPYRQGEELASEPGEQPLAELPLLGPAATRAPRERGRVLVDENAQTGVQSLEHSPVDEHPEPDAYGPAPGQGSPGSEDAERLVNPRDGGEAEGEVEAADETLDAVLDEGGGEDGPLPRAQPADAAGDVGADRHAGDGLDGEVAVDEAVVGEAGDLGAPEEVADDVVLAHVRGEVVDARGQGGGGSSKEKKGVAGGIGGGVEVGFAKHVALADDAGGDADEVDGAVELGVRRGHEHLLEPAATVGPGARGDGRGDAHVAGAGAARDRGVGQEGLAFGSAVAHGGHGVDDQGELVDELEGSRPSTVGAEAAEPVDHAPCDVLGDPDVAVERPEDIALGLPEGPTHVSDLGIRADLIGGVLVIEVRVLRFDKDAGVEVGEVGHELAEDGIGGVLSRLDAEVHGQLVSRVRLVEDGGEAFVERGLEALGWSDDGDMGDVASGQGRGDGFLGYGGVFSKSVVVVQLF